MLFPQVNDINNLASKVTTLLERCTLEAITIGNAPTVLTLIMPYIPIAMREVRLNINLYIWLALEERPAF